MTPSDIKALEAGWAENGMTANGVQYAHRILSAALKSAVKMELIFRNPALVVDPPSPEKQEVRPPDVATVNNLPEASGAASHRFYPAMRLIAYTRVRRGECLGLHWRDVDLVRQEITITASLVRSAELGLILEPPKSRAGRRVINLDDGTAQVLREHKVRQMEHRLVLGSTYQDDDFVFPDGFGAPLNPMALTRALQRAARQAEAGHVKTARPAALPRLSVASERPESRTGEQAVRALKCQHDFGCLRPPDARLAKGSSRGVCQGHEPTKLTAR